MSCRTLFLGHLTAVTADLHSLSCIFQNFSRLPILGLVLGLESPGCAEGQKLKVGKVVREPSDNNKLRPNWTSRDLAALGTQPH